MDTGNIPVYCHMTDTGIGNACGGGGWTLVMKIDGRKVPELYFISFFINSRVCLMHRKLKTFKIAFYKFHMRTCQGK